MNATPDFHTSTSGVQRRGSSLSKYQQTNRKNLPSQFKSDMVLIDENDEKYVDESGIDQDEENWKENKQLNNPKDKSQDFFHKPKALKNFKGQDHGIVFEV